MNRLKCLSALAFSLALASAASVSATETSKRYVVVDVNDLYATPEFVMTASSQQLVFNGNGPFSIVFDGIAGPSARNASTTRFDSDQNNQVRIPLKKVWNQESFKYSIHSVAGVRDPIIILDPGMRE